MPTRRIYYDDAFAKEFSGSVVACESIVHNGVAAWGVLLDRSAFYPASGGQPHDLGRIAEGNVLDVQDEGEEILHVVDHCVEKRDVACCIDWPRRFDHMQQHTGQHLLSAMFQERFGRPTLSFHLGSDFCTIDLRGPEPTEEVLEGAERAANRVIYEDRPITVRYGTAEDLAKLGVRKEVERSGILRAIEIEGADLQPCGGTHVRSTGQVGTLLVRKCSKMRQDWRVEFVCGARAERAAREDFRRIRATAEKMACAPEDLVTAAERAVSERDAHFKRTRALLQRLAETESARAVQETQADGNGLRVIQRVFDVVEGEYLGFFGTETAKTEKTVALLASAVSGDLIFAQHPGVGKDMNALLKLVAGKIGGKGGGSRDFARGRLSDAAKASEALALAREALTA